MQQLADDVTPIQLMLIWGQLPWGHSRCPRKTGPALSDHRWQPGTFKALLDGEQVPCNCDGITLAYGQPEPAVTG